MENFHRLLELFMDSSHPGWENILLSWRFITRSPICGVDLVTYAANQWPRSRLSLWSFVFWPWKRCFWLGFENDRGSCFALGAEVVANFSLSVIWILYIEPIEWLMMDKCFLQTVGHSVFCIQLLWRAWQSRCHDECGWDSNVFSSDFTACREKEVKCPETWNTSKGYDHKASKEINVILTLPAWGL